MIRKLREIEITGLNKMPPLEWSFDLEAFLRDFIHEDYFFAFNKIQDNRIIGTGNVLVKDKTGWLANIIVDKNYRRKGLGFEMTKFLVDFLKEKGCETQLLIATELGEPVYNKIGFKKLTDYQSFDSVEESDVTACDSIRLLETSDLESIYKLDQETNGENRTHLIDKFYHNGVGYFSNEKELLGFYLPNFGRGLVLARDELAGIELLKIKHSKKGKRTLIPIENQRGIDFLENMKLEKGVKSSKMILGKENNWKPNFIYSYASGYCG